MDSKRLVLGVALAVLCSANVHAEQWNFEFTPYLWAAANKGSTGAFAETANGREFESLVDVDISFQDLIDHTEYGTMFNFSGKKDGWLAFTEYTHLNVTDDQSRIAGPNGGLTAEIDLEITGSVWDVAVGHHITGSNGFELYGYAGVRYMDLEADLDVSTVPELLNIRTTLGDDWTDVFFGTHMSWIINEMFTLQGRAELGGFSDEPSENLLVNVTLSHQLSKAWEMKYFYRFMSVDYADDGFVYDMEVSGPGVGVSYVF